jgi:multiple sugar transport system ATP-binding protein
LFGKRERPLANIRLEHIFKTFGTVQAVRDVSLSIEDGEFFTLLGPSGCGKTTILRIIAGLEKADKGNVYIGDTLANDLDPKDRDVGVVFQSYALYPHMSVYENLAFPLEARKWPKETIEEKVQGAARILQIEDFLGRKPKQLSGGQQQRVALGRAIVRDAKAYLMDEPLSNLDAKLRIKMRGELKRLQKDLGITAIYVTHDQEEAMAMSDRIAILNQGLLQQLSKPMDAYLNPTNQWVAGFIGSPAMNFFSGHLKKTGNTAVLVADDLGSLPVPLKYDLGPQALTDGTLLTLGVRPEHMRIAEKPGELTFQGSIYVIEPVGEYTIVEVVSGKKALSLKISGEISNNMGDEIPISFNPEKIYFFDQETGRNLLQKIK